MTSAEEQQGSWRFRSAQDRKVYLERRAIVRAIISRYFDRKPQNIQYTTNRFGKPSLIDSPYTFNISKSDGVLVVALSLGCEVGVDTELVRPVKWATDVALNFFSLDEQMQIKSSQDRNLAFLMLWTQHESAIKAFGFGLASSLGDINVTPDEIDFPNAEILANRSEVAVGITWTHCLFQKQYVTSVASASEPFSRIRFFSVGRAFLNSANSSDIVSLSDFCLFDRTTRFAAWLQEDSNNMI